MTNSIAAKKPIYSLPPAQPNGNDVEVRQPPLISYCRSPTTPASLTEDDDSGINAVDDVDVESSERNSTSLETKFSEPTGEAISLVACSLPSGGEVITVYVN